ncbi:MAG: diguanylate cyclase [Actinomycetota bacterium]|nr:diguanylate cyclase [Actinomycetota bacterium]
MLGEARSGRTGQLLVDVPFALALICALVNVAWKLLLSPSEAASLIDWLYNLTFVLGGLACLGRALHSPGVRAAWLAFGAALISWGVGDIYWTEVFASAGRVPYPSPADIGYLLAPVCLFAGIALLMRDRGCFTLASCFDAAIGALAATALGTAFLAPALEGLTRGDSAAVLTNVSYPIFDLLLVAMIAGSVVIGGLRGARSLLAVGAGLIVWTGADVQYLFLEATGSYEPGWIDMTWAAGALLIAGGASLRPTRNSTTAHVYRSQIVLLTTFSLIAVGILVWDHFERVRGISIWLAGATILAVAVRLAVSFRENERLMLELHDDTVTDALTGLGNRRKLYADLDVLLPQSRIGSTHHMFAIFDLDGFKSYNDTFGHRRGCPASSLRRAARLRRDGARKRLPIGGATSSACWSSSAGGGRSRSSRPPAQPSPRQAKASRSARRVGGCCCRRRRTAATRSCGRPTSGCTPRSRADPRLPCGRRRRS